MNVKGVPYSVLEGRPVASALPHWGASLESNGYGLDPVPAQALHGIELALTSLLCPQEEAKGEHGGESALW